MVVLKIIGLLIAFMLMYKVLELFVTPLVLSGLWFIYTLSGQQKKFAIMCEQYRAKKGLYRRANKGSFLNDSTTSSDYCVNPATSLPMISGTSTDVCGNALGTDR